MSLSRSLSSGSCLIELLLASMSLSELLRREEEMMSMLSIALSAIRRISS